MLPFDSEYMFRVSNSNQVRVKVEIDIDGTNVTGGGLVLSAGATEYIERFVETAKKFKFVRASNEAVADPTNEDNGSIVVRITREYQCPVYQLHHRIGSIDPWHQDRRYGASPIRCSNIGNAGDTRQVTSRDLGAVNCSDTSYAAPLSNFTCDSFIVPCSAQVEEKGATVEGSKSKQVFGSTTWAGDEPGSTVEFVFNLHCRTAQEDAEYQQYLRLQKKFG
jgi:hypothetical protein